jgi:hypothetical protein
MKHRADFRKAPTMLLRSHKLWDRAREMSRERSRGQPGTIEIGARFAIAQYDREAGEAVCRARERQRQDFSSVTRTIG